jgi:RIO kinase 2
MELIDAFPLRQLSTVSEPSTLYSSLMELILRFASMGLIHGDFNEFNILVYEDSLKPIVIDFPQMISTDHPNAKDYFDRDVQCIKTFFERRFRYTSDDDGPHWSDVKRVGKLDIEVQASGFSKKQWKELEKYMKEVTPLNDDNEDSQEESREDEADEDDDDDEAEEGKEDNEKADIDLPDEEKGDNTQLWEAVRASKEKGLR